MENFTFGTSSQGIKRLQERLREFGFYNGKITSDFDEATQAAIVAFQSANSLSNDGVVGLLTLHALDLLDLGLIDIS